MQGQVRALCLDKTQFWQGELRPKTGKPEDKNVAALLIDGPDNYCYPVQKPEDILTP